jgi:hypothetical protein
MREGHVREDGMVFWKNCKKAGEIWIKPESYKKRCETRKKYRKTCAEDYRERQAKKNPMDRSYFGKYDFSKNKYFIGISNSGKEVWVTKDKFDKAVETRRKTKAAHLQRVRSLPKTGLKLGDVHPDDPNLFVIFFSGNKPHYGDKQRLEERKKRLRQHGRLRDVKNTKKRRQALEAMGDNRLSCGAVNPLTGLVFWEYSRTVKEIWLPLDEFHRRRNRHLESRRKLRINQKELKKQQLLSQVIK